MTDQEIKDTLIELDDEMHIPGEGPVGPVLLREFDRIMAERDAALSDVPHECRTCKHKPEKYGVCGMGCEVDPLTIHHAERCNWEWRGAWGEA